MRIETRKNIRTSAMFNARTNIWRNKGHMFQEGIIQFYEIPCQYIINYYRLKYCYTGETKH